MFVMPSPFGVILYFFPDECFVSFVPGIQKIVETAGTSLPQIGDDPFQLDGSGHLGIPGQVAGNDGILMEVTHLDWDFPEKLPDTASAVQSDGLNVKPLGQECPFHRRIDLGGFRWDEIVPDRLAAQDVFGDKQTEPVRTLSEKCRIGNQGNRSGNGREFLHLIPMDLTLNPLSVMAIFPAELFESHPMIEIIPEDGFSEA